MMKLICSAAIVIVVLAGAAAHSAELVTLSEKNWDRYAPRGKEVDCIYGDFVLRNDRIVAVIAKPVASRNANLTVRGVGGCVIDLTVRDRQSDQLSAFYPAGGAYDLRFSRISSVPKGNGAGGDTTGATGREVALRCVAKPAEGKPLVTVEYRLADGDDSLRVVTAFLNPHAKPIDVELFDRIRADRTFQTGHDPKTPLAWWYDKWFAQAYGCVPEGHQFAVTAGKWDARTLRYQHEGKSKITLAAGKQHRLSRRLFPAANLLDVRATASRLAGTKGEPVIVTVSDPDGPVGDADVVVLQEKKRYAWGRTDAKGNLATQLAAGKYQLEISALGRGKTSMAVDTTSAKSYDVKLPAPGYVVAKITSEKGEAIPCKMQFRGVAPTPSPDFGPDSGEHGVKNLYYSHNGDFRQAIAPGKYNVIISHGPEYDAVYRKIEVSRGRETIVQAKLIRTVDTAGWVSSDFHGHSSPSGDNTASQYGRVLNLLGEHIEFAPCTEHNRLSTYQPHLARMKASHLLATCVGMELTGRPGSYNHQNAFPLVRKPRTQDGGGPQTDVSPVVQIERLAMWDGRSDKLLQQNHPSIMQILGDRDNDGKPDEGFERMFGFMDVIEVHPPIAILSPPGSLKEARAKRNAIFHWLQMLNLGYRIPGIVNTDSHYNFHGSGFLRNYIKSPTDDPAKIKTMDMVHAAERGNLIMTTGPFLSVKLTAGAGKKQSAGTAGDDVAAPDGKAKLHVRVQCANWLAVDRVQVLLNGRLDPKLNFTRRTHPSLFGRKTVRFDRVIPLTLKSDTHVIVVAVGENASVRPVMEQTYGNERPLAVCNPIFVDVDGGGFKANGDLLGVAIPLPPKHREGEKSPPK